MRNVTKYIYIRKQKTERKKPNHRNSRRWTSFKQRESLFQFEQLKSSHSIFLKSFPVGLICTFLCPDNCFIWLGRIFSSLFILLPLLFFPFHPRMLLFFFYKYYVFFLGLIIRHSSGKDSVRSLFLAFLLKNETVTGLKTSLVLSPVTRQMSSPRFSQH